MPPPDRASPASSAPLDELLSVVLRQFRRPLAAHGVTLTDAEAAAIAGQIASRQPPSEQAVAVRRALLALISESETVLARWNLSFIESLTTDMDSITGWETTSDFLEIANEKSNAELRIASGAALAAALGDWRYTPYLLHLAARHDGDLDTVLAQRVLLFASGVDRAAPDWFAQVQAWVEKES